MGETMGAVAINNGVDYKRYPTSCGKPIPLVVQAAIKDPATGKTLKDGERGELCIKSHFNMKGYQNRPEDTAKVIDSEGFFHTGNPNTTTMDMSDNRVAEEEEK